MLLKERLDFPRILADFFFQIGLFCIMVYYVDVEAEIIKKELELN